VRTPLAHDDLVLSVIVPAYNEATTLEVVVRRLREVPVRLEIIVAEGERRSGAASPELRGT